MPIIKSPFHAARQVWSRHPQLAVQPCQCPLADLTFLLTVQVGFGGAIAIWLGATLLVADEGDLNLHGNHGHIFGSTFFSYQLRGSPHPTIVKLILAHLTALVKLW